ncbi:hypothetical protein BCR43DRAFT_335679 [Syncephalastrum racemosum]|uniref:BAT2 N-terminal domain-containing protein n=1 Tax=Syncephalastrum racemosum TaxID=13706 RepID=A0A1X2H8K5_SYNRA|nr:hypothetical protein BCR43DRAFT_335679 [Syncephalastrum racemosum]
MSEYSTSNNSGRYTSKKYNASPNPGGTRGGNTRARLLTSKKVSAPLPLNLPSLRREHASGSDQGSASPNASASGWGSSPAEESIASPPQTSLSPASPPHRAWSATASSKSDTLDQADSHCMSQMCLCVSLI